MEKLVAIFMGQITMQKGQKRRKIAKNNAKLKRKIPTITLYSASYLYIYFKQFISTCILYYIVIAPKLKHI